MPDAMTAWATCERGDWMLWLLGKLSGPPGSDSRKQLVLIACDCAELAWQCQRTGETKSQKAIAVARSWASGDSNITLSDVMRAASAAADAAADDAADDAAYAAAATAYAAADAAATAVDAAATAAYAAAGAAAYAAYAAADADADAADAAYADADTATAYATAYAAYAAAADAARTETLRQCANIVRVHCPGPPEL